MGKEIDVRIQDLMNKVNSIDRGTVEDASPHFEEVWKLEKRGVFSKGMAVLEVFPELEEQAEKGRGRLKKGETVSFNSVSSTLGRSTPTVINWVRLVLQFEKDKKRFEDWLKDAVRPKLDAFQRKLIAMDGERKNPEPNVKKAMEDKTFLSVMERVEHDEYGPEDVKWLVQRVRHLVSVVRKALQYILDEKPDKAAAALQEVAEEK